MEESSMKKTIVPQRLLVNTQSETCVTMFTIQGMELTNLQTGIGGVGYFLTTQKYFATNRKPKKILSKKQNPKKYNQKHYSFRKSHAWYDNNRDPWLLKHLVNKTGLKNILLKIWNTLKYSFYWTTRKYSSCDQYPPPPQKNRFLKLKTSKNTLLILVCKIIKSENKI